MFSFRVCEKDAQTEKAAYGVCVVFFFVSLGLVFILFCFFFSPVKSNQWDFTKPLESKGFFILWKGRHLCQIV